jgi:hypothetical protein
MTLDELIAEGEALSRSAWALGPEPTASGVVGYWGGERSDLPNAFPPEVQHYTGRRHIVTLSEGILPAEVLRPGPVSLFEWTAPDRTKGLRVEADYRLRFDDLRLSGDPLYATPVRDFPPFPAVCLYGSESVGRWLAELGLGRHDYWQVRNEIEDRYTAEWARRSQFHTGGWAAVVGGWHFVWPEDDFFMPPEMRLIALTLRDAEPWYEIWYSRPCFGFTGRARMS